MTATERTSDCCFAWDILAQDKQITWSHSEDGKWLHSPAWNALLITHCPFCGGDRTNMRVAPEQVGYTPPRGTCLECFKTCEKPKAFRCNECNRLRTSAKNKEIQQREREDISNYRRIMRRQKHPLKQCACGNLLTHNSASGCPKCRPGIKKKAIQERNRAYRERMKCQKTLSPPLESAK